MATASPDDKVVPVIKNADHLNLVGLAKAVNDLYRAGKDGESRGSKRRHIPLPISVNLVRLWGLRLLTNLKLGFWLMALFKRHLL